MTLCRCLLVHFAAVGVVVAQYVACELNHHHLHAEADAERGNVVRTCIFGGYDFSFDATLSESGANHYACHALQAFLYILFGEFLTVHEMSLDLVVIVSTGMCKRLQNTLVSVLQVVFADQGDVDDFGRFVAAVEERAPRAQRWGVAHGHAHLAQDDSIQSLCLHAQRHFVDGRHVDALDYRFLVYVAEVGYFFPVPAFSSFSVRSTRMSGWIRDSATV